MYGWMDGWMDGWVDRWMWDRGRVARCTHHHHQHDHLPAGHPRSRAVPLGIRLLGPACGLRLRPAPAACACPCVQSSLAGGEHALLSVCVPMLAKRAPPSAGDAALRPQWPVRPPPFAGQASCQQSFGSSMGTGGVKLAEMSAEASKSALCWEQRPSGIGRRSGCCRARRPSPRWLRIWCPCRRAHRPRLSAARRRTGTTLGPAC